MGDGLREHHLPAKLAMVYFFFPVVNEFSEILLRLRKLDKVRKDS